MQFNRLTQPTGLRIKFFVAPKSEESNYFVMAFPASSPYPDIVHCCQANFGHLYTFGGDLSAMSAKNKIFNYKIVKVFFRLIE